MKNTIIKDAIVGVVQAMDLAEETGRKILTPEKTQYEKRKEWNEKTLADIRAMPPEEAIKGLMKHRGRE